LSYCSEESRRIFRIAVADMPRHGLAPHPDVPLGLYRHYKMDVYEVTGGALLATGDVEEILVIYRSVQDGYQAARTIQDFTEYLRSAGVRRFERCPS
jgi:hypothetical protein